MSAPKPRLSEPRECPCGRQHGPAGIPKRKRREAEAALGSAIVPGIWDGSTAQDDRGVWQIDLHGDCLDPVRIGAHSYDVRWPMAEGVLDATAVPVSVKSLHAVRSVRCRSCIKCRWAKRNFWGLAGMKMTQETSDQGNRTWFMTLTISPEAAAEFAGRAMYKHPEIERESWRKTEPVTYFCKRRRKQVTVDAFVCDARFDALREVFTTEAQRYFKRLRGKRGAHRFKYVLVFERHKSGLPHAHILLHECNGPILKSWLVAKWPWGFVQANLVGGRARNAASPHKAAWYVSKYLTKSHQSRLIASIGYSSILKRAKLHRSNDRDDGANATNPTNGNDVNASTTRTIESFPYSSPEANEEE